MRFFSILFFLTVWFTCSAQTQQDTTVTKYGYHLVNIISRTQPVLFILDQDGVFTIDNKWDSKEIPVSISYSNNLVCLKSEEETYFLVVEDCLIITQVVVCQNGQPVKFY